MAERIVNVASALAAWRFAVRTRLARHPRLYLPLARWKYRSNDGAQAVGGETEIVIEGFPRSANTFAVVAFQLAQGRPVKIAHHLHAPAQIVDGVRLGIPVILLIREPEAAVRSLMLRKPELSARQAFRTYCEFYEPCVPLLDSVTVAPFEEVTTDFGRTIRSANMKYGMDFTVFDHSAANVERCYAVIEEMNRAKYGGGQAVDEKGVARPSAVRDSLKEELGRAIRQSHVSGARGHATRLYERICRYPIGDRPR